MPAPTVGGLSGWAGRRTAYEKELDRLYDSKGHKLTKHPSYRLVQEFLTLRLEGDIYRTSEVELRRLHDDKVMARVVCDVVAITMTVEQLNALMREAHEEAEISIKAVGIAHNKVKAMAEVIVPQLHELTTKLRSSRQTAEAEMRETMKWLNIVREFFLESKYETEMKRLQEFVALCKEIQALKDAGTLDAVADLAIALACSREKTQ